MNMNLNVYRMQMPLVSSYIEQSSDEPGRQQRIATVAVFFPMSFTIESTVPTSHESISSSVFRQIHHSGLGGRLVETPGRDGMQLPLPRRNHVGGVGGRWRRRGKGVGGTGTSELAFPSPRPMYRRRRSRLGTGPLHGQPFRVASGVRPRLTTSTAWGSKIQISVAMRTP